MMPKSGKDMAGTLSLQIKMSIGYETIRICCLSIHLLCLYNYGICSYKYPSFIG